MLATTDRRGLACRADISSELYHAHYCASFKQLLAYISRGLNANRAYSFDTTSYRGHLLKDQECHNIEDIC